MIERAERGLLGPEWTARRWQLESLARCLLLDDVDVVRVVEEAIAALPLLGDVPHESLVAALRTDVRARAWKRIGEGAPAALDLSVEVVQSVVLVEVPARTAYEALGALDGATREVLLLRRASAQSVSRVAATLGRTRRAVRASERKGRRLLAERVLEIDRDAEAATRSRIGLQGHDSPRMLALESGHAIMHAPRIATGVAEVPARDGTVSAPAATFVVDSEGSVDRLEGAAAIDRRADAAEAQPSGVRDELEDQRRASRRARIALAAAAVAVVAASGAVMATTMGSPSDGIAAESSMPSASATPANGETAPANPTPAPSLTTDDTSGSSAPGEPADAQTPTLAPTDPSMPSLRPTSGTTPTSSTAPSPWTSQGSSPSSTPVPAPSAPPTVDPTPSPEPAPTPDPTPTPAPTPDPTPSTSPTPDPTPSTPPEPTPEPAPSETPSPSPSP